MMKIHTLFACILSVLFIAQASAQGAVVPRVPVPETCERQEFCMYSSDPRLLTGAGRYRTVPRFYHMAQQCYLSAALLTSKGYADQTLRPGRPFTDAETGVSGLPRLPRFCTEELSQEGVVINAHVVKNVRLLYSQSTRNTTAGGTGAALDAVRDRLLPTVGPEATLATEVRRVGTSTLYSIHEEEVRNQNRQEGSETGSDPLSPEGFLQRVVGAEFLAYRGYLQRAGTPSPQLQQEALAWSLTPTPSTASQAADRTNALKSQARAFARLDPEVDAQIALSTMLMAESVYAEFLRSYTEHLYLVMLQETARLLVGSFDRMERAMTNLGVKLPDAFVTGN